MLNIALKEWAVVCDLLVGGELAILLRKGGIHEDAGPGRFQMEHDRFALFPAWEHQDPGKIKPAFRGRVEVFEREPEQLVIKGYAIAEHIHAVPSRAAFDQLDDLHCWTAEQIDMRFHYKPDRPLYLLVLRVYRLPQSVVIANNPHYAGCKSWVDFGPADAVNETGATPAMDDESFERLTERLRRAISHP